MFRHMLGCLIPMMLLFVLPLFGVSEGITLVVFMVLMFACHLSMMGGHHGHTNNEHSKKGENHGDH